MHQASGETAVPLMRAETVGQKVRRLQAEARSLARDHTSTLIHGLGQIEQLAAEIAAGGDAYPPGVRDLARRIAEDSEQRAQILESILGRAG